jgi:type VI secretion system protein ImpH
METEVRTTAGAVAATGLRRGSVRGGEPARDPAALLAEASAAPHGYQLFALLRLFDCAHPDLPRLGRAKRPRDEVLRLGQDPALEFAAAAIARIEPAAGERPARLVQRVLGLFGSNGALPTSLSEYAFERLHHAQDRAFVRFADIFHHRMLSLFYRAWAASQPAVSLDRPKEDFFGTWIAALCGLGMPALRERDAVGDFVKLGHAGIFGHQVKSAEGLQIVLANYLQLPVRIEQWRGHWLGIPRSERSRIGRADAFASLGENLVIGERVWDCQAKFRIVLGPLGFADYERFLPGGRSYRKLADLVRLYVGDELAWELQLVLAQPHVPEWHLGSSMLLGYTLWLSVRLDERNADDLVLCGAHEQARSSAI